MSVGTYQFDDFEQAVKESNEIHEDTEIEGASMGVTVGSLLEYGRNHSGDLEVIVSTRSTAQYPLGIDTTVTNLEEMVELIETFGPHCMSGLEFDEDDDSVLHVGYHFD